MLEKMRREEGGEKMREAGERGVLQGVEGNNQLC